MKLYNKEIEVAGIDSITYEAVEYGDRFYATVHHRPENRRWHSYRCGNDNGYKTERGAMNAIRREANKRGHELVF